MKAKVFCMGRHLSGGINLLLKRAGGEEGVEGCYGAGCGGQRWSRYLGLRAATVMVKGRGSNALTHGGERTAREMDGFCLAVPLAFAFLPVQTSSALWFSG